MKKIYKVLLLITTTFLFSACNYLDVVPDEKAKEEDAFEDTSGAKRFLYSCYAHLPNPRSGDASLDFMTGDEVVTAFEHETFASFPKGNYSASTPVISYWDTLFQGLRQCYIFLNNIDKVPGLEESIKADYIAQSKFLIAYYHFLLIRCYGPVILIKEEPYINTTPADYAARSSYDECVQYVCDLFDESAENLPVSRFGENFGLATSVAAKSLKAKLLLYAASPLFNGNTEFYGGDKLLSSDGTPLMPQTYDPSKWTKAKKAFEEAIALAGSAGYGLYTNKSYQLGGLVNLEPKDPILHQLRYNIIEPANSDIIWSDSRGEGGYSIQNKSVPFSNGAAFNGVAPTLTMLKRFYTKNGLPIDKDPEFNYNGMFNVVTISNEHSLVAEVGAKTIELNLGREPRFYSWIAFQGGFFEIKSKDDGNGAYDDDASYNKYSDQQSSKLVCDFIVGGNTSRGADSKSLRTNNYSPTGYLNKKGIVPGFPVSKGLSTPPFYPWPIVRFADLCLGLAESSAESGDLNTAKTYLNYVRVNSGIPTVEESWAKVGVSNFTKEQLINIIRQERLVEFYLENQSFWDLRRWKEAGKYFNVKAKGLNISATTIEDFAKETEVVFERKFNSPTQYLMPIPIGDVNKNLKIVQNPGY